MMTDFLIWLTANPLDHLALSIAIGVFVSGLVVSIMDLLVGDSLDD